MLHATFNNISVISWRSVLLVEETGVPGGNNYMFVVVRIIGGGIVDRHCLLIVKFKNKYDCQDVSVFIMGCCERS